jgi:hypothetical protein
MVVCHLRPLSAKKEPMSSAIDAMPVDNATIVCARPTDGIARRSLPRLG